jgi:DNA mismatch repair protein MutL
MPDIIRLLPDSLANKIAAGEVVQRPSSAVKELLENAIDAGSTEITLIVKDGGKQLIQVIDNGKGMSAADARMCFERHATSKLKETEDLFKILTYGFRGEAMASIAAVSRVEMSTKPSDQEVGNKIIIEGSKIVTQEACSCQTGTSVSIKNLFFNVPARRNFLKSTAVELKHILEEFERVAISFPEIGFKLFNNDLEMHNLTGGKLSHRIVQMFGKSYQGQLVEVDEKTDYVSISGYIGKPDSAKKTRGEQYFIANRRFIKHHYLNHAVQDAFEGIISDRSFPFYVLNLDLDPSRIDVNVHPTKTEVKFDDERTIYAIVRSAIKMALGKHAVVPSIDFEQNINFGVDTSGQRDYGNAKAPFEIPAHLQKSPREKSNQSNWQNLYSGFESKPAGNKDFGQQSLDGDSEPILIQSVINTKSIDTPVESSNSEKENFDKSKFQIHNSYIITQVKSGIIMIDQQRAHEKVLYEKYMKAQENKGRTSQQFLFPQTVILSMGDYAIVTELETEIKALGFSFNDFGKNTIVINGIPAGLTLGTEQTIFENLIEQFKVNRDELKLDKKENLARSLAKRSAIPMGKKLNAEEIDALISDLFACENPNYDPSGKPTFVIMNLETIANYFA